MSILESDIELAFRAFCKKMSTRGDAEWDIVVEELDFDAGKTTAIRAELRGRYWIRQQGGGIYTITGKGLQEAKRLGILSQAEYEEKKYQIFDR